jgi:hypothetical protein
MLFGSMISYKKKYKNQKTHYSSFILNKYKFIPTLHIYKQIFQNIKPTWGSMALVESEHTKSSD